MAEKVYVARPMNNVSEFNSQVDIIIPYHGQYEKVMELMESIRRHTRSNYYRVCLVDDASPNEQFIDVMRKNALKTGERAGAKDWFVGVRSETQLGYAGACKLGFYITDSPYVCFMNSDCVVEDVNWLRALGESLLTLKDQGVRMVAPMTNNIVGGHPAQHGTRFTRADEDKDVVLEPTPENYLSLYCVLCHRELFSRCGGFFKEYPFGFFEDQEFAVRMQKHGFKQAVSRKSWLYHHGESTIRTVWRHNPQVRKIMEEENRERCMEDIRNVL